MSVRLTVSSASRALAIRSRVGRLGEMRLPSSRAMVVVDTMIASAWLGTSQSRRPMRWALVLQGVTWVLPFTVVVEMRFGAEVAGWGPRHRGVLETIIHASLAPLVKSSRSWSARG